MADGGSCMIHALAFNTLLSSQETDAYTVRISIISFAIARGVHLCFILYQPRRLSTKSWTWSQSPENAKV
ncbi:hypothetical protein BJ982_004890 [Sphaerisporangium siamense]|uniref:Uncharacterized protein n=1 Tax=Sphaerisporangium siamense TaxID=795645 RepID=A0A7W7GDT5_9ACTN|nr:hypothetical protein [Sphaerisporangium siamense]